MKLFCDCAHFDQIKEMSKNPLIKGFTTNPSLMHKAGITDYKQFSIDVVKYLSETRPDTCISLEVFADEPIEILNQARTINSWFEKDNYPVYIKIPVINTQKISMCNTIWALSTKENVKLNVTAILSYFQATYIANFLSKTTPSILSIFAGRIHDCGVDAVKLVNDIIYGMEKEYSGVHNTEILWASPRQVYDYKLAKKAGADIITMTPELINKLELFNKDLEIYSRETVEMFYNDGQKAGFNI